MVEQAGEGASVCFYPPHADHVGSFNDDGVLTVRIPGAFGTIEADMVVDHRTDELIVDGRRYRRLVGEPSRRALYRWHNRPRSHQRDHEPSREACRPRVGLRRFWSTPPTNLPPHARPVSLAPRRAPDPICLALPQPAPSPVPCWAAEPLRERRPRLRGSAVTGRSPGATVHQHGRRDDGRGACPGVRGLGRTVAALRRNDARASGDPGGP